MRQNPIFSICWGVCTTVHHKLYCHDQYLLNTYNKVFLDTYSALPSDYTYTLHGVDIVDSGH